MVLEPEFTVELNVNGKGVEMNEFVHKIVGNLILAILKSLRLDSYPKTVTLNMKIK
jgi:hypothetical protein